LGRVGLGEVAGGGGGCCWCGCGGGCDGVELRRGGVVSRCWDGDELSTNRCDQLSFWECA
jgi:hypothetical protein